MYICLYYDICIAIYVCIYTSRWNKYISLLNQHEQLSTLSNNPNNHNNPNNPNNPVKRPKKKPKLSNCPPNNPPNNPLDNPDGDDDKFTSARTPENKQTHTTQTHTQKEQKENENNLDKTHLTDLKTSQHGTVIDPLITTISL